MEPDAFDRVVELDRSEVIGVEVGEEECSSISGFSTMDDDEDEAEIELVAESDR